jgi:hypothetical protein
MFRMYFTENTPDAKIIINLNHEKFKKSIPYL